MADNDEPGGVDSISRGEFQELADGLSELREAVQGLHAANSPAEKRDAKDDVADAEESLEQTARRLGVSRASLEKSIQAAKAAERKEELRGPLEELLQELGLSKPDPDDSDDGEGGDEKKAKAKAKARPRAAATRAAATGEPPAPEPDDTAPVKEHWSERGIGAMLR